MNAKGLDGFKNLCILVLWKKVTSVFEGLKGGEGWFWNNVQRVLTAAVNNKHTKASTWSVVRA